MAWAGSLALLLALPLLAEARLGEPNSSLPEAAGGLGSNASAGPAGDDGWTSSAAARPGGGYAAARLEGNLTSMMAASSADTFGYQWSASTTRYGNTDSTSCGGLSTVGLVAGTGYYSVASSQAMQSLFQWGAPCCYCGEASPAATRLGVAPMGCFTCARGRFLRRSPYGGEAESGFASKEIKIVVSDVCPGDPSGWCQAHPGDVNFVGEKNHFDFSVPPLGIDNNYFVFTVEECSPELHQRMAGAEGKCRR